MANAYMQEAIKLAQEGMRSNHGGPFGAVIIQNGRIIARGYNQVLSSCDPTAHAEVVAIREACKQLKNFSLKGCEIYTSCEPCPMCLTAIYWARLDKIYYGANQVDIQTAGFDDLNFYQEFQKDPAARLIPMQNLMREEAVAALTEWKDKVDKIPY